MNLAGGRPARGVSAPRASRSSWRTPPVGNWGGSPPQVAAIDRFDWGSVEIARATARSDTVAPAATTVASSAAAAAGPRAARETRPRRVQSRLAASPTGAQALADGDTVDTTVI